MAFGKIKDFVHEIFTAPDPHRNQRESIKRIIQDIKTSFPEVEHAIREQAQVSYGGVSRRLQDFGAATGAPDSLTAQRLISAGHGTERNMLRSLGEAKMRKAQILQNIASIIGSLPGEPVDTSLQDMMSMSMKWATGGFAPLVLGGGGGDLAGLTGGPSGFSGLAPPQAPNSYNVPGADAMYPAAQFRYQDLGDDEFLKLLQL